MGKHSRMTARRIIPIRHHPVTAVVTWARGVLSHPHPQPVTAVAEPGAVEWLSGDEWCQRHSRAAAAHQAATLGHDAEAVQA